MKGIIYKYTSPSGKVYIGQTLNEERRKKEFLDLKIFYSGTRLENARQKYGPENFKYEILVKDVNDIELLNNLEIYYIQKFN